MWSRDYIHLITLNVNRNIKCYQTDSMTTTIKYEDRQTDGWIDASPTKCIDFAEFVSRIYSSKYTSNVKLTIKIKVTGKTCSCHKAISSSCSLCYWHKLIIHQSICIESITLNTSRRCRWPVCFQWLHLQHPLNKRLCGCQTILLSEK